MLAGHLSVSGERAVGITLTFFVAVLVCVFYLTRARNKGSLPPGPIALPIVGCVYLKLWDLRKALLKMSEKYGDVFTIYIGRQPVVVLTSYEALKEAYVKNAHIFCGRPWTYLEDGVTKGGTIVSMKWSQALKDQRRFLQTTIKDLALASSCMEDVINTEMKFLLQEIMKAKEQPFDISQYLRMALVSCTHKFTFGSRLHYDDSKMKFYMHFSKVLFELGARTGILGFVPFLKYIPGDLFNHFYLRSTCNKMVQHIQHKVAKHRAMLHETKGDNFVDLYLQEINRQTGNPKTSFTEENLVMGVFELLTAANESTITTLRWAIAFLAHNPQIQSKVQAEIDKVLGKDGTISMVDTKHLHYSMACLSEVQRLGDPAPLPGMHSTLADVNLRGHFIPKGTWILQDFNAIHHNSKYFDQPTQFRPERFLDSQMKYVNPATLLPFGIGKRACPGKSLARMELTLIFVGLLQKFSFALNGDDVLGNILDGVQGIRSTPRDYKVRVMSR